MGPTYTFFSDMANMIMNGMGTNLFSKAGNLIAGVAPLFQVFFSIYVLLLAFDYYKKGFDESVVDIGKSLIGWVIIIACAFNASQYDKIANIIWELPDRLSGFIASQEYTASALDTSASNVMNTLTKIPEYAASLDFTQVSDKLMLYIGWAFVLVCSFLFFVTSFAYYVIAKLSLAMVILIGPIFLGSFLFPSTRQWGMNWVGQVLNYSVTIMFFTILGSLQQDFFTTHLQNAIVGEISSVAQVLGLIPIFFLSTVFFILVAWSIPSIASALTGGASVNGFSRTIMSVYAWGKTKALPSWGRKGGNIGQGK